MAVEVVIGFDMNGNELKETFATAEGISVRDSGHLQVEEGKLGDYWDGKIIAIFAPEKWRFTRVVQPGS